jgi:serine/threonine protein kinase
MRLDSLAEVARGGMGSVELVRVLDGRLTGQMLAIKRLHANIAEDPEFVAMFLDEAWITAALRHPNVAQVMAWGNDEKGTFLAIELVQGVSLSRLLKEAQTNQEPFAERTVAFICSQICAGLTAAHTLTGTDGAPLGLVHRDLTPANVLVSFDGLVKIIDFGIAKAEERISHTRTGQLKGKPSYMAPEQQRGAHVDHRADLFAFGVSMFELLAGRRPWTAKGAFDVMMEISNDPHPDLGELRKGLNPEFVAIAHKCLAKSPDERFGSAAEIKARLDAWLAARGFTADDQESLARFVLRNSQPQVLWWQEALRGEHANAKKKVPTFKELEEKIDEDREKHAKEARRAAAAALTPGVARPPPLLKGTVPMQAYPPPGGLPGDHGGAPLSSRMGPPSSMAGPSSMSGPSMAVPPSMAGPPSSGSPPRATPLPLPRPVTGIGTEFLPPQSQAVPFPASQHFGYGQPPQAAPLGTESGTAPMSASVLAAMAQPPPSSAPGAQVAPRHPSAPPSGVAAPAPGKKGSRALLIVLLVAIPVLGAAAAAWVMRDELLNLVGAGATEKAPVPAPGATGKAR